jgi:hypothetical protein
LRRRGSRSYGYSIVAAFAIFVAVYGALASCFYWLMQPSVVANQGMAAYHPPPATVVRYSDAWVPPDESDARSAFAYVKQEYAPDTSKAAAAPSKPEPKAEPKAETRTREVRAAPRRQARPRPAWNYTAGSPFGFGFRPWF